MSSTDAGPTAEQSHPGGRLGLPSSGTGSLAAWQARIAALMIDWAACILIAIAIFGMGVMRDSGWIAQTPMMVFFVQSFLLTTLLGGTFGQLLARIGVTRLDGGPIRWWQALARTALKCLVIPCLVVGVDRRHLADILLGTVVVNRR